MKPIIILPPDAMSPEDIQAMRDNDLCVVVAKDPAAVNFIDPIPAISSRTEIENAAILLSRRLLNGQVFSEEGTKLASKHFVELLCRGTPLDRNGTKEEQERAKFEREKEDELYRIAREEARAQRAAEKEAKAKKAAK